MQPGSESNPSMSMPSSPCCICGEPVENGHVSTCYNCSRTVHIRWSGDHTATECSKLITLSDGGIEDFLCVECVKEQEEA